MNINHTMDPELLFVVYSRLDQAFPGREEVTQKEAAQYLGITAATARRYLSQTADGKISKATLFKHSVAGGS